ncbi:MAG: polysaccharide deacetylase family protein [Polyangiaceae bacterium]|jgi:peptidoglycan/xylan/chitin deacetylase (PgdA/CDA1 family)
MLIKVPAALFVIAILGLGRGSVAWLAAFGVLAVGVGLLAWLVFNVNSSFWATTLWRAEGDPSPRVALTFDDGPDPEFTPLVLDVLAAKNVPAAFFVVGRQTRLHPELVSAIDRAGHLVGNHSDHHGLWFHFRLWTGLRREIFACNAAISAAIGKQPLLFRSPQGFKNPALGDVLRQMGLLAIGWQVRGLDAIENDADKIVQRIVSNVRAGGVVQMHDGAALFGVKSRRATLDALPRVIDGIRARGLQFVRLDLLLGVEAYERRPPESLASVLGAPGSTEAPV